MYWCLKNCCFPVPHHPSRQIKKTSNATNAIIYLNDVRNVTRIKSFLEICKVFHQFVKNIF